MTIAIKGFYSDNLLENCNSNTLCIINNAHVALLSCPFWLHSNITLLSCCSLVWSAFKSIAYKLVGCCAHVANLLLLAVSNINRKNQEQHDSNTPSITLYQTASLAQARAHSYFGDRANNYTANCTKHSAAKLPANCATQHKPPSYHSFYHTPAYLLTTKSFINKAIDAWIVCCATTHSTPPGCFSGDKKFSGWQKTNFSRGSMGGREVGSCVGCISYGFLVRRCL